MNSQTPPKGGHQKVYSLLQHTSRAGGRNTDLARWVHWKGTPFLVGAEASYLSWCCLELVPIKDVTRFIKWGLYFETNSYVEFWKANKNGALLCELGISDYLCSAKPFCCFEDEDVPHCVFTLFQSHKTLSKSWSRRLRPLQQLWQLLLTFIEPIWSNLRHEGSGTWQGGTRQ